MDDLIKDNEDNWFVDICKWAESHNLSHKQFPRDITQLQNIIEIDLSDTNIEEIPPQIKNLTKLVVLSACGNNIKELPLELFKLKSLCMLDLANNKISIITNKIDNLSLLFLDISNNPIETLPQIIYKKQRINTLNLHNTNIQTIPEDICQLKNLNTLTFDDKHLPSIAKCLSSFTNINSINLTKSNYDETSKIIQNLDLKYDTKEWIGKEHKRKNGIIKLCQESKFTPEDDMEDMVEYGLSIVNKEPEEALRMYHEVITIYNLNEQQYLLPNNIFELSITIVLNIADTDIAQAVKLLDIIDLGMFRIETIDKLIVKTDNEEYKRVLKGMKEELA